MFSSTTIASSTTKPGATIVWEESVDVPVTVPEEFSLEDERHYGAAAVRFLTFGAEP